MRKAIVYKAKDDHYGVDFVKQETKVQTNFYDDISDANKNIIRFIAGSPPPKRKQISF